MAGGDRRVAAAALCARAELRSKAHDVEHVSLQPLQLSTVLVDRRSLQCQNVCAWCKARSARDNRERGDPRLTRLSAAHCCFGGRRPQAGELLKQLLTEVNFVVRAHQLRVVLFRSSGRALVKFCLPLCFVCLCPHHFFFASRFAACLWQACRLVPASG